MKSKTCKFWTTPDELGSVVSRSIVKLQKRHPAIGWVRANEVSSSEALAENLRLRNEVERLKERLEQVRTTAPQGTDKLAQGEDRVELGFSISWTGLGKRLLSTQEIELTPTWDRIFYAISPLMISEAAESDLMDTLSAYFADTVLEGERPPEGVRSAKVRIEPSDFQTVKVQYLALGMIEISDQKRSVKDTDVYWRLTPYGNTVMQRLRAVPKQVAESEEEDHESES